VVSPRRTVPLPDAPQPACTQPTGRDDRVAHLLRTESAAAASPPPAGPSAPLLPSMPLRPPVILAPEVTPSASPPLLRGDGASGSLELVVTFVVFLVVGFLIVLGFAAASRALDPLRRA
jgi:hypothetical protein